MSQMNLFHFYKRTYNDVNANETSLFLRPLQSSPSSSPPVKRSKLSNAFDSDENQMIIDAGQKQFGAQQCKLCGMVYDPTFGPDNISHQKFHEKTLLRFVVMPKTLTRSLPPVQEFSDGYIYRIISSNSRSALQIVEQINSIMDNDFGACNLADFWKADRQVYLFVNRDIISFDRKITGCLIVDHLKYAFKYLNEGTVDDRPTYSILGVNRIWVNHEFRRRKIATRLLDAARCNFIFGYVVLKKHVAFSDPTPMGRELAKTYAGLENLYVY